MKSIFLLLCTLWLCAAQGEPTALGRWRQMDDDDGKLHSIIRIEEHGGLYEGRIEKFLPGEGEDGDPICITCPDQRKGKKIIGMQIVSGLKRNGLKYEGGEILDPDNGKLYRVKMSLAADGRSLAVRGFIGLSLFGRSQTWLREE
ncbi:MAG: signal peptide protein [Rhodocyclales bacterium]|nr:signal peptide protein [Rhodocyclales bacterium]